MGAGLILRDSPVVCITGNAGLLLGLGELGTLARLEVSVVVVVFKDQAAMEELRSKNNKKFSESL